VKSVKIDKNEFLDDFDLMNSEIMIFRLVSGVKSLRGSISSTGTKKKKKKMNLNYQNFGQKVRKIVKND